MKFHENIKINKYVRYWASEACPTLMCSIEISRDICNSYKPNDVLLSSNKHRGPRAKPERRGSCCLTIEPSGRLITNI